MKELRTLNEFNENQRKLYNYPDNSGNGIACPMCGTEMFDVWPDIVLTSNPPQKHVKCPKCCHRDLRIA